MNDIELRFPVPEWAVWLAQDGDGEWYVFDTEPYLDGPVWVGPKTAAYIVTTPVYEDSWKTSLTDLRS